jgi:hypothetical protein
MNSRIPLITVCLFFALWLVFVIAGRSAMFRDPGTFWHVVVGNNILSSRQLPREDTFSFTRNGKPWIADQWLAEILMAALHRVAGWDGLLTCTAAVLAGIYAFIAVRLLRAGVHWLLSAAILALALLAGTHQFHVRPLVFTLAGLAIAFSLLVDIEAGRKSLVWSWLLVPLFIIWTNLHGGVLAGVGSAILCAMGWILLYATGKISPVGAYHQALETFALIIVFALCLLVNPYGADMVRIWLQTLSMPLPQLIEEHGPLTLGTPIAWATLGLGAIYIIVLLSVLPQRPRITWLVPLVFFALALRVRNAPLFAIAAVIALPDMLPYSRLAKWLNRRQWLQRDPRHPEPRHSERGEESHNPATITHALKTTIFANCLLPLILISTAMFIQAAGIWLPVVGAGWVRFDAARWPMDLLPELQSINETASAPSNRVFNDLRFGGFLMYHAPNLQVFIDDRCPLYGSEFIRQYDVARRDDPRQIEVWQTEYHFSYALVQAGAPFDSYLRQSSHWTLLGRRRAAALYKFNPRFSSPALYDTMPKTPPQSNP